MAHFEPADQGLIVQLEDYESDLLHQLVDEMKIMLEADIGEDPVHKRLYPQAYQDEDAARAYNELVGNELRSGKVAALKTLEDTLERDTAKGATLTVDETEAWLRALSDLRLAIGTRLEVTEEKMGAEVDVDDPEAPALSVLHWLGWMQESILESISTREGEQ